MLNFTVHTAEQLPPLLQAFRKEAGLTQSEVALRLGVSQQTYSAMERNADKVSGVWVFQGTRVPVRALFENLEAGARLDEFLEWFPGVTRE